MITYTYDFEILTMSTVFMNAMSDIIVKRYNETQQAKDQIKARVVYAPKQRVLNDLLDKDQNIKLPVVSVTIGGIARDEGRVFNKLQGNYFRSSTDTSNLLHDASPVPIDITYNVSILTRYQQDMDQILSHLIPYINPYFTVSWRTPQRPDFEIRSNVFWNGQANVQYPIDLTATVVARVTAELTFTFKGWLFRNIETAKPIFTIDTTIQNTLNPNEFTNFVYDAVPIKPVMVDPYVTSINTETTFLVWGSGFEKTLNVHLSGSAVDSIKYEINPFAGSPLETSYPKFNGITLPLSAWSASSEDNFIKFTIPKIATPGLFDVIVQNAYSYGNLKKNVKTYPNETPPYFPPYANGIKISSNTVLS